VDTLHAVAGGGELRVGIMCRGPVLRAWQAEVVRHLLEVPGVVVPLLVVEPPSRRTRKLADLLPDRRWLWRLFNNRWVARRSRALRPVDMTEELAAAEQLVCRTERRGRWSEHFRADDLASIRDQQPDVLIRFAYGIIRGEILDLPRYGVWSFHHGDVERYRGGPPAFWEVMRGDDVSGAILQRLTERLDGGVVLRRGWFSTVKHSYTRNADRVRLGGTVWPAQMCREVLAGRTELLDAPPTTSTAPIDHDPTNAQMVRFAAHMVRTWLPHQTGAIGRADRWRVGIIDRPIADVALGRVPVEPRWVHAGLPRREYLADPFGVPGRDRVVAEHFSYRTGIGRLVAVDPGPKERVTPMAVPFAEHASYPFLIDGVDGADGPTCVPQVTGTGGVRAYDLTVDGPGLTRERILVPDVEARDPTIVHHDGRWWCFFTDGRQGAMSHLHIWWSESFEGPWVPHEGNPVKIDVRSSRPAGTPFVHDGALHRPAQDCARAYGGAVVVNRVDVLTPHSFAERPVATIRPAGRWRDAAGCHTLSAWDGRTLIDAHWRVVSAPALLAELRARVKPAAARRHLTPR
jgi:hypothetical protein